MEAVNSEALRRGRGLVPATVECGCGGDCRCRPGDKAAQAQEASVSLRLPSTLDAKLSVFDEHAEEAVDELITWLRDHRGDLIALARGRHVEGHYRYGDSNFLEWGDGELLAQTAQELADAIVYGSRTIHRRS